MGDSSHPPSANALFDSTVSTQAAMMGINDIFYVSAIIFVMIIPLIWITHRRELRWRIGCDRVALRSATSRASM